VGVCADDGKLLKDVGVFNNDCEVRKEADV
jgi:hypothetical protein